MLHFVCFTVLKHSIYVKHYVRKDSESMLHQWQPGVETLYEVRLFEPIPKFVRNFEELFYKI